MGVDGILRRTKPCGSGSRRSGHGGQLHSATWCVDTYTRMDTHIVHIVLKWMFWRKRKHILDLRFIQSLWPQKQSRIQDLSAISSCGARRALRALHGSGRTPQKLLKEIHNNHHPSSFTAITNLLNTYSGFNKQTSVDAAHHPPGRNFLESHQVARSCKRQTTAYMSRVIRHTSKNTTSILPGSLSPY